MLRWLRRLHSKYFVRIVYSPEVALLGPILDTEWSGLLLELAQGYEKHQAVFRAVQILLRQTEQAMLRVQHPKTPDQLAMANTELRELVREANAYRRILRLPIESQKARHRREAAEKAREVAQAEADLEGSLD